MKKETCTTATTLQINAAVDALKHLESNLREAESAISFEMTVQELERITQKLELLSWARGA